MDPTLTFVPSVPPTLEPVEFQNDVMAVQGSEVVLPCEARGSPLPLVSWMKDGEPLLPQILEQGPGLKLEAVSIGDSGTYSCMAASEAGEARRSFRLTVMGGCAVLSSFSDWRVRGTKRKCGKASPREIWGQHQASPASSTKQLWLRNTILLSSISMFFFFFNQTLVSKQKLQTPASKDTATRHSTRVQC